jgi:mannose-1-phosphate guanylyltransferase
VRLVDKLVFGRYCVDKNGSAIDLQAAALDWLITDTRQMPTHEEIAEREKMAQLIKLESK